MVSQSNFIGEHELAQQFGVTVWALRDWRRRGYGPKAFKIGKKVCYLSDEINSFLANLAQRAK